MKKITRYDIDAVLEATDLVGLISETVKLTKRGREYQGLCPFHQERTPSFHVNEQKQLWHCHGCHAGGNALKFVQMQRNLKFGEALRLLAERAGIQGQETTVRHQSPSERDEALLVAECCDIFWQQRIRALQRFIGDVWQIHLDLCRFLELHASDGDESISYEQIRELAWYVIEELLPRARQAHRISLRIEQANARDRMTVYLRQPAAVRQECQREAIDRRRFEQLILLMWRDAAYRGETETFLRAWGDSMQAAGCA